MVNKIRYSMLLCALWVFCIYQIPRCLAQEAMLSIEKGQPDSTVALTIGLTEAQGVKGFDFVVDLTQGNLLFARISDFERNKDFYPESRFLRYNLNTTVEIESGKFRIVSLAPTEESGPVEIGKFLCKVAKNAKPGQRQFITLTGEINTEFGGVRPIMPVSAKFKVSGGPLVFVADQDVEVSNQVESDGHIHANDDIVFKSSRPSTYAGNLTALDKIQVLGKNTLTGIMTAGHEIIISGDSSLVNGPITINSHLDPVLMPQISFSAGSKNIKVPRNGSSTLLPGSYGNVEVGIGGKLFLSAGEYFVAELELEQSAVLEIDVTNDPVTINITKELKFASLSEVVIKPFGQAGADQITFNVLGQKTVEIDQGTLVFGTIVAPNAQVGLEENSRFKGIIYAKEIEADSRATFRSHLSTALLDTARRTLIVTAASSLPTPADSAKLDAPEIKNEDPVLPSSEIKFPTDAANDTRIALQINTVPSNADIIVDDKYLGQSPLITYVVRGQDHVIQISKEGHNDSIKIIDHHEFSGQKVLFIIEKLSSKK